MPTALITLGRLPKALTLARHLHHAGFRVIVAEPFSWHIARASRAVARSYTTPAPNKDPVGYRNDLLEIIEREHVSLVVPVSEEIHHVLPIRSRLPQGVTLLGPTWSDYCSAADKLHFSERAEALGLSVPATHCYDSQAASALEAKQRCIYKPRQGCSGVGIVRNRSEVAPEQRNQNTVAQAFIEGRLVSTLTLVINGREVTSVFYEGKVFAGTVAICFEQIAPSAALSQWVTQWANSFQGDAFIALDLIIDDAGQPWGIECNPRLTSGIHFFRDLKPLPLARSRDRTRSIEPVQADSYVVNDAAPASSIPRWQWGYSTLTEAYAALFKGDFAGFRQTMKWLRSSRDCVWSLADPLPFLLMTPLSLPILWPALTEGLTLGEACQRDIAPLWDSNANSGASDNAG